jgi:hypothetical protein
VYRPTFEQSTSEIRATTARSQNLTSLSDLMEGRGAYTEQTIYPDFIGFRIPVR